MTVQQNVYQQMSASELSAELSALRTKADEVAARKLSLDMARGKPSPAQVALSAGLLDVLNSTSDLCDSGVDCANYGCFEGIASARVLASELLGCPPEQTLVMGSSSLLIEFEMCNLMWRAGTQGHAPWCDFAHAHGGERAKLLCPSPGYDRHFGITDDLGIENVYVPMTPSGPDMDIVERLVATDDSIKGIWCVPKYSNPTGVTFSDETVERLARMSCAAPDFRVFWDNAYCVHDLYETGDTLLNIFEAASAAGTEDRVVAFASTSKITFPGAGIAFVGASPAVIAEFASHMQAGLISADKLNQLRHVRFLPNMDAIRSHMKRHAEFVRPKFDMVERMLTAGLSKTNCATWTHPRGGYFVSFDGPQGSARRIGALCAQLGVKLTCAGATFPYGRDPHDTNIRIAPTYPELDELEAALDVLVLATKIVAAELAQEERAH